MEKRAVIVNAIVALAVVLTLCITVVNIGGAVTGNASTLENASFNYSVPLTKDICNLFVTDSLLLNQKIIFFTAHYSNYSSELVIEISDDTYSIVIENQTSISFLPPSVGIYSVSVYDLEENLLVCRDSFSVSLNETLPVSLSVEKDTYLLGEEVPIQVYSKNGTDFDLLITLGLDRFAFIGSETDLFRFKPPRVGNYTISLSTEEYMINKSILVDSMPTVINGTVSIGTDKKQYLIGNQVRIFLNFNKKESYTLSIINNNTRYSYLGIPDSPLIFYPKNVGNYSIVLEEGNKTLASYLFYVVNESPTAPSLNISYYDHTFSLDTPVTIRLNFSEDIKRSNILDQLFKITKVDSLILYVENHSTDMRFNMSLAETAENVFNVTILPNANITEGEYVLIANATAGSQEIMKKTIFYWYETTAGSINRTGEENGSQTAIPENITIQQNVSVLVNHSFLITQQVTIPVDFTGLINETRDVFDLAFKKSIIDALGIYIHGHENDTRFNLSFVHAELDSFHVIIQPDSDITPDVYKLVAVARVNNNFFMQQIYFNWGLGTFDDVEEAKARIPEVSLSRALEITHISPLSESEQTDVHTFDDLFDDFYLYDRTHRSFDALVTFYVNDTITAQFDTSQSIRAQGTQALHDTYTVEVIPAAGPVTRVMIFDYNISSEGGLGIDAVSLNITAPQNVIYRDVYAIDPTSLLFANATITGIANGTILYKCKDWNFSTQTCYGSWEKLQDLVPGEFYSVTITGSDPAFAEALPVEHDGGSLIVFREQAQGVGPGKIMRVSILLVNNMSKDVSHIKVTESLPTGWRLASIPENSVVINDTFETDVSFLESGDVKIVNYSIQAPLQEGYYDFRLHVSYNESSNATRVSSVKDIDNIHRVDVNSTGAFFEIMIDSYSVTDTIDRLVANDTIYSMSVSIKNIGNESVTKYDTYYRLVFDEISTDDVIAVSNACRHKEIIPTDDQTIMQCRFNNFFEGETKQFTFMLRTPSEKKVYTMTSNVTYDPPYTINLNKVSDDPLYDVYLNGTVFYEDLIIDLYHDSQETEPISIDGGVNYSMSKAFAEPYEHVRIFVYDYANEYFTLSIGDEERFTFGTFPLHEKKFRSLTGNVVYEVKDTVTSVQAFTKIRTFFKAFITFIKKIFTNPEVTGQVIREEKDQKTFDIERNQSYESVTKPVVPEKTEDAVTTSDKKTKSVIITGKTVQYITSQKQTEENKSEGVYEGTTGSKTVQGSPAKKIEKKVWYTSLMNHVMLVRNITPPEEIPFSIDITDSKSKHIQSYKEFRKVDNKTYDVGIIFDKKKIRTFSISHLRFDTVNETFNLGIDDVLVSKVRIEDSIPISAFAINPEGLVFDNASFTSVASGEELWKCKDWNFSTQTCYGTWVKIMDIVPGQEYRVSITADDPGYAETGIASINTRKSMYHLNETVDIIIVVLDKNGYLVSGADVNLTVRDPYDNTIEFMTSENSLSETGAGVYETEYNETVFEGNYSLSVHAHAENTNSSMESYFTVKEYYEFDIIRDAPATIDPWQGAFTSSITIFSYVNETTFNLTEKIPSNFSIIAASGADVGLVNGTLFLRWTNLTNESVVTYTLEAPLVSPELFTFGKAIVEYGTTYFEEARYWYIALDPEAFVNTTGCALMENSGSDNNYGTACTGTEPWELNVEDTNTQTAEADKTEYCGIQTTHDLTIPYCDSVENVEVCIDWWFTGTVALCQGVDVSIDGTSGTWEDVSGSTCPTSDGAIQCYNVTGLFNWDCDSFDGANAAIRAHLRSDSNNKDCTFDAIFFNVTYTEATTPTYTNWNISNTSQTLENYVNVTRGAILSAHASWSETPDSATIEHNGTGSFAAYDITAPYTGDWTNYTLDTNNVTQFAKLGLIEVTRINVTASSGLKNYTQPEKYFYLWGTARLNASNISASNILENELSTLGCQVTDHFVNISYENYVVTFYNNETGLLGTNTTGSDGWAYYTFSTASQGTYKIICNITDNQSTYHHVAATSESSQTLNVLPPGSDVTPPTITDVSVAPSQGTPGQKIVITANVTDESNVSVVIVNITAPDSVVYSYEMNNISDDIYRYNFTTTSDLGTYSYFIWANDTNHPTNTKKSSTYTFEIIGTRTVLSMQSVNQTYKQNTDVLLKPYVFWNSTDQETGEISVQAIQNIYSYSTTATFNRTSGTGVSDAGGTYASLTSEDANYLYIGATGNNYNIAAYIEITYDISSFGHSETDLSQISVNMTYCHSGEDDTPDCSGDTAIEGTANGAQNVDIFDYETGTWTDIGDLRTDDAESKVRGTWNATGTLADYVNDTSEEVKVRFEIDYIASGNADGWLVLDYSRLNVNYSITSTDSESTNTTYTGFNGPEYAKISDIDVIVELSGYNSSGSSTNDNNNPDIEIAFYDGTRYSHTVRCSVSGLYDGIDGTGIRNCTKKVTNATIVDVWNESANRQIQIRGINMDDNDTINWSSVFVEIETPSKLENYGILNLTNTFIMQVDRYVGGAWVKNYTVYNQSITIAVNQTINVSDYWDDSIWKTDNYELGTYRVYGALTDGSGNVIQNEDNSYVNDSYEFTLDFLRIVIDSPLNSSTQDATGFYVNVTLEYTSYPSGGWCVYGIDGGTNHTMLNDSATHFYNFSTNVSVGSHNITVYCNDTEDDISTLTHVINAEDLSGPNVYITSPGHGSEEADGNINFTYNVTDTVSAVTNCTLIIDYQVYDVNDSVTEGIPQNMTASGLSYETHIWWVNCSDEYGNVGNSSRYTFLVGVDNDPPVVSLKSPPNHNYTTSNDILFSYTVYDTQSDIVNCTLIINDLVNETNASILVGEGDINYFQLYDLAVGQYNWSVNCTDASVANNVGNGSRWNLTILDDTDFPTINLEWPLNGYNDSDGNIQFRFNVSDASSNIENCSLIINGTVNQTNSTIFEGVQQSFTVEGLREGNYTWSINCTDDSFNNNMNYSETRNFTVIILGNIDITVSLNQSYYEIGTEESEIIEITTQTQDELSNNLDTNIIVDIIEGNTSIPWWNSSWHKRKNILINNSGNVNWSAISVIVNVTGLSDDVSDCDNEIRIVSNVTGFNEEVERVITDGDDATYCTIYFNANVSANAVHENNYFVYYNNSDASSPGYSLTQVTESRQNSTAGQETGTVPVSGGAYTDTHLNNDTYWYVGTDSGTDPAGYAEYTFDLTSLGILGESISEMNVTLLYCHSGDNANPNCDGSTAIEGTQNGDQNIEIYNTETMQWIDIGNLNPANGESEVTGVWDFTGTLSDYVNESTNEVLVRFEIHWTTGGGDDAWLVMDQAYLSLAFGAGITATTVSTAYTWVNTTEGSTGADGTLVSTYPSDSLSSGWFSAVALASGSGYTSNFIHDFFIVTVDNSTPSIQLVSPAPDETIVIPNVTFYYNVTDRLSGIYNCSLIINGTVNQTNTSTELSEDTKLNFTLQNLPNADYTWQINCTDNSSNRNLASTTPRTFTIAYDTTPSQIELLAPINWYNDTDGNLTLTFNVTDDLTATANCTLIFNGTVNQTNESVKADGTNHTFTLYSVPEGNYTWQINCTDNSLQENRNWTEIRNITVIYDFTGPTVNLEWPLNESQITTANVTFRYNVTDTISGIANCSLYIDSELNITNTTVSEGVSQNFTVFEMPQGYYEFNITCYDDSDNNNPGYSVMHWFTLAPDTVGPVITLKSPPPDTEDPDGNITFSYNVSDFASGVFNCSLIIDGEINQTNHTIDEGETLYFNVYELPEASYEWSINCTDDSANYNTQNSSTWTVIVGQDQTPPVVTLVSPVPYYNDSDGNLVFVYKVDDYASNVKNCSLIIDGEINWTNTTIAENVNQNFSIYGLPDKNYTWSVNCTDNSTAYNVGNSSTRNFSVINDNTGPIVTLISPSNNTWDTDGNRIFYFNVTDTLNSIENCTLIFDGQPNETKTTGLLEGETLNFTITGLSSAEYNWSVNCTDDSDNSNVNGTVSWNLTVTLDTVSPVVTLYTPVNNTLDSDGNRNFTYSVIDAISNITECSLVFNGNDVRQTNDSIVEGTTLYFYETGIDEGQYNWTVQCIDGSENANTGTSEVRNITVIIDEAAPVINLLFPLNFTQDVDGNITFNFTISDVSDIKNCSLIINGTVNQTNTSVNKSVTQRFFVENIRDANYTWSITCTEISEFNRTGASKERFIIVAPDTVGPDVDLLSPPKGIQDTDGNLILRYNVTDFASGISNCTLTLNGTTNETKSDIRESQVNNFTIDGLGNGNYTWFVNCTDDSISYNNGNSSTWNFTVGRDETPPDITLISPGNNTIFNARQVTFEFSVNDYASEVANCSLYIDKKYNKTLHTVVEETSQYIYLNMSDGNYNWSINCTDDSNQTNSGMSDFYNFTVFAPQPILFKIWTNASSYEQGEMVLAVLNTTNSSSSPMNTTFYSDIIKGNGTASWWNVTWHYRIPVEINATDAKRVNRLIDLEINFTDILIDEIGQTGLTFDENSIRLIEWHMNDSSEIVSQFETAALYDASDNAFGTLYWIVNGTLEENTKRHYYIYFDSTDYLKTAPGYPDGAGYRLASGSNSINASGTVTTGDSILINNSDETFVIRLSNGTTLSNQWTVKAQGSGSLYNITVDGTRLTNLYSSIIPIAVYDNDYFFNNGTTQLEVGPVVTKITMPGRINNVLGSPAELNYTIWFSGDEIYVKAELFAQFAQNENEPTALFNNIWFAYLLSDSTSWSSSINMMNSESYDQVHRYTNPTQIFSYDTFYASKWYTENGSVGSINLMLENFSLNEDDTQSKGIVTFDDDFDDADGQSDGVGFNLNSDLLVSAGHRYYVKVWMVFSADTSDTRGMELRDDINADIGITQKEAEQWMLRSPFPVNFSRLYANITYNWSSYGQPVSWYSVTGWATKQYYYKGSDYLLFQITPDVTPPDVTLVSPAAGWYNYDDMDFDFTVYDNNPNIANCTLVLDGALDEYITTVEDDSLNRITKNNMVDANYSWTINCTDAAGNIGTYTPPIYIVIDTVKPNGNITSPDTGNWTQDSTPDIRFNASDNLDKVLDYVVYVDGAPNGQSGTISNGTSYTLALSQLENGSYSIYVRITDEASNYQDTKTVVINVDTVDPEPVIHTRNNTWFNVSNPTINFSITENLDTVLNYTFFVDDVENKVGHVAWNTATLVNLTGLKNGSHTIILQVIDEAKNAANSTPIVIHIDTEHPVVELESPIEGATDTGLITFEFNVTDNYDKNLSCNLTISGDVWVTDINATNGTTTSVITGGMDEAVHYWNVTCWDNATNKNTSETRTLNYFNPPEITLGDPVNGTWNSTRNITFFYTPSEESGIANCSLILDGTRNVTNTSLVTIGVVNNFTVVNISQGRHNWTINCTDIYGYQGTNESVQVFYVDITAPTPTIETDNRTWYNIGTPTFYFNVTDNLDRVLNYSFYVNGVIDTETVGFVSNGTSSQSDTVSQLGNGTHTLYIETYDNALNYKNSSTITFYIDSVTPNVTLVFPINYYNTTSTSINFNWTAADNMAATLVCNITIDGTVNNTAPIYALDDAHTNYTVSGFSQGSHTWNIACMDNATNKNTTETRTFTVDTSGPTVTLNNPPHNHFNRSGNITFYYTPNDVYGIIDNCTLILDGEKNITNKTITESVQNSFDLWLLPEKIYNWTVNCTDNLGNVGSTIESRLLYIDRTAPTPTFETANRTWFNTDTPTISFNITDNLDTTLNYTVYVDGTADDATTSFVTNGSAGQETTLSSLADGSHTIYIESYDDAGNYENTSVLTIYVDTAYPTFTLNFPVDYYNTSSDSVNFNWTVSDNLAQSLSCNITLDGTVNNTLPIYAVADAPENYTITGIVEGTHYWNVTCIDNASNTNTSATRQFTVDNTAPTIALASPRNESWNNSEYMNFSFTPDDSYTEIANCTLILNGERNETETTVTKGSLTTISVSYMTEGTYQWMVNCTDSVGNTGSSQTRVLYMDRTEPSVVLNVPVDYYNTTLQSINFNWTADDNIDTSLLCNLTINGTVNKSNIVSSAGSPTNYTVTGLNGTYVWNVTCWDNATNTNTSVMRRFTVDLTYPIVYLITPYNNTWSNTGDFSISYKPYDDTGLLNCSLVLDGTINKTNKTISNDVTNYFNFYSVPEGTHTWYINCTDTVKHVSTSNETRTFYVDKTKPVIYLKTPIDYYNSSSNDIDFIFNVTDNMGDPLECNVSIDGVVNNTSPLMAFDNQDTTYAISDIPEGDHTWKVTCWDNATNTNISETRNLKIDTQPPTVVIDNPSPNEVLGWTIYLQSTVTDSGAGVSDAWFEIYNYTSGLLVESGTLTSAGGWDYDWDTSSVVNNESDSNYFNFTVYANDTLGNVNQSSVIFIVDNKDPTIDIQYPDRIDLKENFNLSFIVQNTYLDESWYNITNSSDGIMQTNSTTGIAAADFNWTDFVNISTWQEGGYNITVYAIDTVGNNYTTISYFRIDRTKPIVTLYFPEDGYNDSDGSIAFNFSVTDNLDPQLSCNITIDGTVNNTSPISANNGSYTYYNLNLISQGDHDWNITCDDNAGNTNISETRTFTVDTSAPTVTLNSPQPNEWNNSVNMRFSYTPSDTYTNVENCTLILDGENNITNSSINEGVLNYFTVNAIPEKLYNWSVNCSDSVGNVGYGSSRLLYIDRTAPTPTFETANRTWFNTDTPTLSFNITDNLDTTLNYTVYVDGTADDATTSFVTNGSAGQETTLSALADGSHTVYIETYDDASNYENTSVLTIYVDTAYPTFTLNFPVDYYNTSSDSVNFNWTVSDNLAQSLSCNITLDGTVNNTLPIYAVKDVPENYTIKGIVEGTHYWNVTCIDNASNTNTSATRQFTVDNTAPTIALASPRNESWNNSEYMNFSFTPDDSYTEIANCTLILNGERNETDTSITKGAVTTISVSYMTEGTYQWMVNCTDSVGNTGSSKTRVLYMDRTEPSVVLNVPVDYYNTTLQSINFNWTADDNIDTSLLCNLTINGTVNKSNIVSSAGSPTNVTVTGFSDDHYTWNVTCWDNATNTNTSPSRQFMIDTTGPDITSVSATTPRGFGTNVTITGDVDDTLSSISVVLVGITPPGGSETNYSMTVVSGSTYQINSFTDYTNGSYDYIIYANDTLGNPSTYAGSFDMFVNATIQVRTLRESYGIGMWVNLTDPLIELLNPLNNTLNTTDKTPTFSFNATSQYNETFNCSLLIENIERAVNSSVSNATPTELVTSYLEDGNYDWWINCTDDTESNISKVRNISLSVSDVTYTEYAGKCTTTNLSMVDAENLNISLILDDCSNVKVVWYDNVSINNTLDLDEAVEFGHNYVYVNTTQYKVLNGTVNITLYNLNYGYPLIKKDGVPCTDCTILEWNTNKGTLVFNASGFSNYTISEANESKIVNSGPTNTSPYLLMKVQYYNKTLDQWVDDDIVLNDSEPRLINSSDIIKLDLLFNGKWNTSENASFGEGTYRAYAALLDPSSNVATNHDGNSLETWYNFTYDISVPVPIINTTNQTWFNTANPLINFTITDNIDTSIEYILYVDYAFNTEGVAQNGTLSERNLDTLTDGAYNLTLGAEDDAGNADNSSTIIINIDTTPPLITLYQPAHEYNTSLRNMTFNWSVSDSVWDPVMCNFTFNNKVNESGILAYAGNVYNVTLSDLELGTHTWYVTCWDNLTNTQQSEVRTLYISVPDLFINSSEITFNSTSPVEGENVTINATVRNIGSVDAYDVAVGFYDGDPEDGGTQIGSNIIIPILAKEGGNKTVNNTWLAEIGLHEIYVVVDPPTATNGSIQESNETNNVGHANITISAWHTIFGNVSGDLQIATLEQFIVYEWDVTNATSGNIFVIDSDSFISWSNLTPIGLNVSLETVIDDFEEIDETLAMTNYSDSVNRTYTFNSTVRQNTSFTIFTDEISDVPYINSTNTKNFLTGILWDASDANDGEFNATQDVVFVSKINQSKDGYYGTYDFEIKVPARLREYITPNNDNSVNFYAELK